MSYTLYYATGVCSLSPHIALLEAGLPFDLVKVDLRTKKLEDGRDYTTVSPKGYVPALVLPDGQLLTEGAVTVQYIADQVPEKKLVPAFGTMERYRMMETLHFIATELHKATSPLYSPLAGDDYKTFLKNRLALRWGVFEKMVHGEFLFGDFTVADGYAFYVMRAWLKTFKEDFTRWPALEAYYQRLTQRPSVKAALAAEGLDA
jgi:glutathione S-transferase